MPDALLDHTVTSVDGRFDSGILTNGATYQRTFPAPGVFQIYCMLHPGMAMTLTVEGAPQSGPSGLPKLHPGMDYGVIIPGIQTP